jgi:hypothetical protein
MNAIVRKILDRAARWPEEDQEELAQAALEIELRRQPAYHASAAELAAIDSALAEIDRGGLASVAELEALLAKYRSA